MAEITDASTLGFTVEFDYDEGFTEGDFVAVPAPTGDGEYVAQIVSAESAGEVVEAEARVVGTFPDLPFREGSTIAPTTREQVLDVLDLPDEGVRLGALRGFDVPIHLDVDTLMHKQLGIYGRTEGGKSHTTKVLAGQLLAAGAAVLVVDLHGEYGDLAAPGAPYEVVEYADTTYTPDADEEIDAGLGAAELVQGGRAALLNLRGLEEKRYEAIVTDVLDRVKTERMRETIPPVKIILEEAQEFAPTRKNKTRPVVKSIAKQGRKFGCTLGVVAQRPSGIVSGVRTQMQSAAVHKLTDDTDLDKVTASVEGLDTSWKTQIQKLQTGEALLAGDLVRSPTFVDVRETTAPVESGGRALVEMLANLR